MSLSASQKKQIVKMFKGSKTDKAIKNARKIATEMGLSRYAVMSYLETEGLCSYSPGSYT